MEILKKISDLSIKEASYRVKEGEIYILNLEIPRQEKHEAEDIPLGYYSLKMKI